MGTALTGTEIKDTYDSLLKISDNGPISGTAKYLSDGLGNDSALALSTGNIGIGTTAPQRPLHINGTEGVLRLTSTASGNDGFEVGIGASSQGFLWLAENSHMEFATNNAERMRITSAGNVGIGTASPTAKLQVVGDVSAKDGVLNTNANSRNVNLHPNADFGNGQNPTIQVTTNHSLQIATNNTIRASFTADGLCFGSDSASANALDDYEEGTWTPTLILGGGSVTYTTQTGTYTKIGRLVTLQIKIAVDVATTPSSTLEVAGLPFTISVGNKGAISAWAFGMTATSKVWVGEPTPSTNNIRIYTYDAGTLSNPAADLQNGCTLNITASYEV